MSEHGQHLFANTIPRRTRIQLRISERRLLLMIGDIIAVVVAIFLALAIWALVGRKVYDVPFIVSQVIWFFVLPLLWFVFASASDFYQLQVAADRSLTLQRLVFINLQMILVYIFVFFLSERESLPRLFILYYGILSFILIGIWRLVNPALIGWAAQPRRAMVVGNDWAARTIIDILQNESAISYDIYGVISDMDENQSSISTIPIVGTGEELLSLVHQYNIKELILTSTRELDGETFQAVMDAYASGVSIVPMPILYERITGRVPIEHVNNNWSVVLPLGENPDFNPNPIVKRLMDIALSLLGLLVFILLLPFLAIAIRLESKGGVFYRQVRVGRNGKLFTMIKLRTMVADAESKTGAVFAQKDDPRVTIVGRFLRRTRLDEVPQLLNVLKGEMSLIGPRPERPEHVERLQQKIPFYRTRHVILPGVTGWAQVQYKYGANDEDAMMKLQYDLYYIRHQSLLLDLTILIRTVGKVLKLTGR